jgi:hypothetical protein
MSYHDNVLIFFNVDIKYYELTLIYSPLYDQICQYNIKTFIGPIRQKPVEYGYVREFSLRMSIRLSGSYLAVIGLTGIGPIKNISVFDWFLPYWPNESFYIVLADLII